MNIKLGLDKPESLDDLWYKFLVNSCHIKSMAWERKQVKFPYSDVHKAAALRISEELDRPDRWTAIALRLKLEFHELDEVSLHNLRNAVNRWLVTNVRERERLYQQSRRDRIKSTAQYAFGLAEKIEYAKDPEIRERINLRVKERRSQDAGFALTQNFRGRFISLLNRFEIQKCDLGYQFNQIEELYSPVIEVIRAELESKRALSPDECWVVDHRRPLASYPLVQRIDFLGEAWSIANLEVITDAENSRKTSTWMGRRWTLQDGDELFARILRQGIRKHGFPKRGLLPSAAIYLTNAYTNPEAVAMAVKETVDAKRIDEKDSMALDRMKKVHKKNLEFRNFYDPTGVKYCHSENTLFPVQTVWSLKASYALASRAQKAIGFGNGQPLLA